MLVKCIAISSIYPSIFNRLRAIARYWSEIATFSYPLALNALVGVFPLEFQEKFGHQKTRITDRQTDRRPVYINNVRSNTDTR